MVWEASDRICGKRLRRLVPILVSAMERHGHLQLAPEVLTGLLTMSAATMDRALREARGATGGRPRRRSPPSAAIRRSVAVRTFSDWANPPPGFMEADLVAHSGPTAKGSYVQTLTLTDIAAGWTECAPVLVREQKLLTAVLSEMRKVLPFALLGFDTDNDSVFMNETVRDIARRLAWSSPARGRIARTTRPGWSRRTAPWYVTRWATGATRAWKAAAALAELYRSLRLFVNFFQPSFKLASKSRDGAKVTKRYHPPATPHQRLISDPRTTAGARERVAAIYATLDPVQLLNAIRSSQQRLVEIADRPASGELLAPTAPTPEEFLAGLRTAWREGEVRPTSKPKEKAKRGRRRPDPLVVVTAQLREWFEAEPWRTAREMLERLQDEQPGTYPVGLLRTLQRRLDDWRRDKAHELVFGATAAGVEPELASIAQRYVTGA